MSEENTEQTEEEGAVVTATENPEAVMSALMNDEKRQELVERLSNLKGMLDRVEEKMQEATSVEAEDAPVKVFSPSEVMEIAQALSFINRDLRDNLRLINEVGSRESRDEMLEKGLEIIHKSSIIYGEIIDNIHQS